MDGVWITSVLQGAWLVGYRIFEEQEAHRRRTLGCVFWRLAMNTLWVSFYVKLIHVLNLERFSGRFACGAVSSKFKTDSVTISYFLSEQIHYPSITYKKLRTTWIENSETDSLISLNFILDQGGPSNRLPNSEGPIPQGGTTTWKEGQLASPGPYTSGLRWAGGIRHSPMSPGLNQEYLSCNSVGACPLPLYRPLSWIPQRFELR